MKTLFNLSIILLILSSCRNKHEIVSREPFEIDRNLNCEGLVKNGYKWMPGDDVILIGKKTEDTLDYYQLEYPSVWDEKPPYESIPELEEETGTLQPTGNQEEINDAEMAYINPLDLPDSVYQSRWGSIKQNELCNKATVYWRYYRQRLNESEIENFRKKLDSQKYSIIAYPAPVPSHLIEYFKVVNLSTKDTFNCQIFKEDNNYYLSTSITLVVR